MKIYTYVLTLLMLSGYNNFRMKAQTVSSSNNLVVQPIPDRTVSFSVSDTGDYKPITWGLDLAWLSESNIRRGIAFMGKEQVDIIRSSFTPTAPLEDGALQPKELNLLNQRINIINKWLGPMKVGLNCDHPSVDPWFVGNASRWAELIEVTTLHHQEAGHSVVTVSPFNEPDYSATGQGTIDDFYNIAGELRKNALFDDIRISGGNTLNNDQALPWYNYLKPRLDEGNTHQLAGSFDNYAAFYEEVQAHNHYATNDELHNVMEAMVGVEYGMQTGIWWGTAELARGEFVKASDGKRLAYAEHRANWTAASVYRSLDGKVQAFGGTSERQAVTTTYRYVSTERDVFFNGHGPQREYTMVLPGGTGYQQGQTNAEGVVNITWGDDIQPVIHGKYVLVNRNSGKVMEVAGGSFNAGANLQQGNSMGTAYQRWNVTPVDTRIGGDFSYYTFTADHSGKSPDILNWSLEHGGNIIVWDNVKGGNQQWYLEYAEDGWFYIRSRHSALCMDVANASISAGANIYQATKTGNASQQWRFLPAGAPVEFNAPSTPSTPIAQSVATSIRLDWAANPETDVEGYTIFRANSARGEYFTIARKVTSTSFVDNTAAKGEPYYYAIKAVDKSLNSSTYSNQVSAAVTGANSLVSLLEFEENTQDSTINANHAASIGDITYDGGKVGEKSIVLNGTDAFLQLPSTIANHEALSVASWVYWKGGVSLQRIFDFGNDAEDCMYLSPNVSRNLRFVISKSGEQQALNAPQLPSGEWSHVAITLGSEGASMYVNGELVDENTAITLRPLDFKPVLNYIGRMQDPDLNRWRLFGGKIDDFRVYNFALSAQEVAELADVSTGTSAQDQNSTLLSIWPVPAKNVLNIDFATKERTDEMPVLTVYTLNGKQVISSTILASGKTTLDVTTLPSGIYMLQISSGNSFLNKKLIIQH